MSDLDEIYLGPIDLLDHRNREKINARRRKQKSA
jgi:hypothetical protein